MEMGHLVLLILFGMMEKIVLLALVGLLVTLLESNVIVMDMSGIVLVSVLILKT